MAAPTGAPRRRSVHPGMHVPRQGHSSHGASAPSAGVCHRCVTHLPGARVAERSDALGAVEIGRHRGMRPSCGRSRAAAARLRRDGGKQDEDRSHARPIPPYCVTRSTSSPANGYGCGYGPRLAQFRPGFLRPLQLQRKVRYDGIHPSTFRRYSAAGLSASERRPPRRSPQGLSDLRARRRRRYVDVPARIGTASPTSACTGSTGASSLSTSRVRSGSDRLPPRSGSQGSPRFLRFLSGSSLPDVNAVTQINFSK